jgi:hypothetical protein
MSTLDGDRDGPHDIPSAAELVEAVREFLQTDVMAATDGRTQFLARVSVNVLAMVERELRLGMQQAEAHGEGLRRLGVRDERALADALRAGELDDRIDEATEFVRATVADKLRVANPRYFDTPPP